MTAILEAEGLGKRYHRHWALRDCSLSIPEGHVVGIVGPNGAGKSTLLNLAAGPLTPTAGRLSVLGGRPLHDESVLARIGVVAQPRPRRRSTTPLVISGTSAATNP